MTTYRARLIPVHDRGTLLEPLPDTVVPDQPNEVNMLSLAVAHALGVAGYDHHPEPRDAEFQTLDALLAGKVAMPWRHDRPHGDLTEGEHAALLVCERTAAAVWQCRVEAPEHEAENGAGHETEAGTDTDTDTDRDADGANAS